MNCIYSFPTEKVKEMENDHKIFTASLTGCITTRETNRVQTPPPHSKDLTKPLHLAVIQGL